MLEDTQLNVAWQSSEGDNESDNFSTKALPENFLWAPEYCERVNSFFNKKVESGQIEETATPALKLHLFNYLMRHTQATEEELGNEFAHINRLSDMEREYGAENNPLPTIGIEIELPKTQLSETRIAVLTQLGIPNESANWEDTLWEVNPSFSYCPFVPARVLEELSVMGAVPLEKTPNGDHERVPKDDAFSLHVNFGLPTEFEGSMLEENKPLFFLLNDCLTYAFATAQRLRNRKTRRSIYVDKHAQKSKKSKNANENEDERDTENVMGPRRVELRAMEFRDYPTFRMLAESQKLMAMLFGSLQYQYDIERSPRTEALSLLWSDFEEEVLKYFEQLQLPVKTMDEDKERVADILEKTDLKQWCRAIVQRYASGVTKVITEKSNNQHAAQQ